MEFAWAITHLGPGNSLTHAYRAAEINAVTCGSEPIVGMYLEYGYRASLRQAEIGYCC